MKNMLTEALYGATIIPIKQMDIIRFTEESNFCEQMCIKDYAAANNLII